MKCEICESRTYVIHVNAKHEKVCTECYQKGAKDGRISQIGIKGKEKPF